MGRYVRKNRRNSSLANTLEEAEDDHFLDCPPAEFRQRVAAFLLDAIFLGLLVSGFAKLCQPVLVFLSLPDGTLTHWGNFALATRLALQVTCVFLYQVMCLVRYGGQPGKLLLECRVVVTSTGQKPNTFQALVREILLKPISLVLFPISLLIIRMRPDRKSLHDIIAHTEVKRNEPNL